MDIAIVARKKTKIIRRLEDTSLLDELKIGDTVSIHWDIPCEILNKQQVINLKRYTEQSLELANKTL